MLFSRPQLREIEQKIGVTFRSPELLERAFIHRSYLNEARRSDLQHNERLEFLGDKVLGIGLAQYLYRSLPDAPEGRLTEVFDVMTCGQMLTGIAETLGLDKYLFMSRGERKELESHKRARMAIMENTYEALVGAIYLDRGVGLAELFLESTLFSKLKEVIDKQLYIDAKSRLQHLVQSEREITPRYRVLSVEGLDHEKFFTVGVFCGDEQIGEGTALGKKSAEIEAAHNALATQYQIVLKRI